MALLGAEQFNGHILEPACGKGHISKLLVNKFGAPNVTSSDIGDYGYGMPEVDFFTSYAEQTHQNIITNPPFSLTLEFAKHSLLVARDKVALFLRIQFLESKRRNEFLINSPLKTVYVFNGRVSTFPFDKPEKGKSGTAMHAWFVWEQKYIGQPIIKWLHI